MLPPRTALDHPQWMDALMQANQARAEILEVRREIRALDRVDGALLLASLIRREHPVVMRMRAEYALMSVRGIGTMRARRIQRKASLSVGATRVGDLSPRQRGLIANELILAFCAPRDDTL